MIKHRKQRQTKVHTQRYQKKKKRECKNNFKRYCWCSPEAANLKSLLICLATIASSFELIDFSSWFNALSPTPFWRIHDIPSIKHIQAEIDTLASWYLLSCSSILFPLKLFPYLFHNQSTVQFGMSSEFDSNLGGLQCRLPRQFLWLSTWQEYGKTIY